MNTQSLAVLTFCAVGIEVCVRSTTGTAWVSGRAALSGAPRALAFAGCSTGAMGYRPTGCTPVPRRPYAHTKRFKTSTDWSTSISNIVRARVSYPAGAGAKFGWCLHTLAAPKLLLLAVIHVRLSYGDVLLVSISDLLPLFASAVSRTQVEESQNAGSL